MENPTRGGHDFTGKQESSDLSDLHILQDTGRANYRLGQAVPARCYPTFRAKCYIILYTASLRPFDERARAHEVRDSQVAILLIISTRILFGA